MSSKNEGMELKALRGAITCEENSIESIEIAVKELLIELLKRNELKPDQILSITFSTTKDIDACFPASTARRAMDLKNVALLDCQQMYVKNDLKKCIRILAHVLVPYDQIPRHVYLGEAELLRPDRS